MKQSVLTALAYGPHTLRDLQRALDIPDAPANRRGRLIQLLRTMHGQGLLYRDAGPANPKYRLKGC